MDDDQLLRDYVLNRSEQAFEALVRQHVGTVYAAALRQVRDPHLAEEVSQAVFLLLSQKAGSFRPGTLLVGWLYRTTHFAARHSLRAEYRRRRLQTKVAQMQTPLDDAGPDDTWRQMSPLLDEAINDLGETDRNAVLLRYIQGKSAGEVALALGSSEEAAKKRTARALDKLRRFFIKHGVVVPVGLMAAALANSNAQAVPPQLVAAITATTAGGSAAVSTTTLIKGTLKLMAWTKMKIAVIAGVAVLLAAGTTSIIVQHIPPSEPIYQGRPFSQWLGEAPPHDQFVMLQRIGPNVIPTLLRMLRGHDERRNQLAAVAFQSMGRTLANAVPDLIQIYQEDISESSRSCAAAALANMGPAATPAVPLLLSAIADTNADRYLRANAATSLGMIQAEPELVIPALIKCLGDAEPGVRNNAAWALTWFGSDAKVAVPALVDLLKDPDTDVKTRAGQALKIIDPAAAAAGIK